MAVWLLHPTGNQNVRAALRGLHRSGLDPVFYTTVAFPASLCRLVGTVSRRARQELARRVFDEVPAACLRLRPQRELLRQLARRLGLHRLVRHETGFACTDAVYRDLDAWVARRLRRTRRPPHLLYAYEDGALQSFLAARKIGVRRVYELPIAYWRLAQALLGEERQRRPDWAATLDALSDSRSKLERKDAELAEAELLVVPSSFVVRSLELAPVRPNRVLVVPYGCGVPWHGPVGRRRADEPLRILFAGTLGQRKGLADLFDALDRLAVPHELTLAGPCPWPDCPPLRRALERPRRRWLGAVPHETLMALMRQHHVLVLPSLIEGLSLVLAEALANALPLVATTHSGAAELVSADGVEGFVVPIRDPDRIADRLTFLYEHEDVRIAMADAARRRAAQLSWRLFEDRIGALCRELTR